MSCWDYMRSPASARLLLDFGLEHGLTASQVLAGSKLNLRQIGDANVEITAAQELRIVDNLLRVLGRPPWMGMEVGWRYSFSVYGLWGYGLISSATVGESIALALRYVPLTFVFGDIHYSISGGTVTLTFDGPDISPDLRRFTVERDMVAACVLLRELVGADFCLLDFNLQHQDSTVYPTISRFKALLGVVPTPGSKQNTLSFNAAYLKQALPQANSITAAMCEQMCQQLMSSRRMQTSTSALISHYLSVLPANSAPSLNELANMTNLSARTLKRKLQTEGTSFRELLANSRSGIASDMLRNSDSSISEIAERLGFSDLSTFSQTFKRWYGMSPRLYRNRDID